MEECIADVSTDSYVQANTNGKGLKFKLLKNQIGSYIHQADWRKVVCPLETLRPSLSFSSVRVF